MAQPTLDEYLAAARPLNPGYSDTQIAEQYRTEFPPTHIPPLADYLSQAKALNPAYNDQQITDQYHMEFGTPKPEPSNFVRGAEVGMEQLVPTLKGAVGLLGETAEQAVGKGGMATAVKEWGLKGYQEGMEKLAPLQRENDDLTTVWKKVTEHGDLGALTDFVTYGLGYGASQLAQAALVGIGGAIAGSVVGGPAGTLPGAVAGVVEQTAAKGLIKSWIEKAVAKRVAQGMAQDAAVRSIARDIGSVTALGTFSTAQEMGQIYPEAVKDGHELSGSELARVWGASAVAGASEVIPEAYLFGKAIGRITGGASRLGRMAGTALTGATLEAGQEAFQTGVENLGAGQPVFDEKGLTDMINAAGLAFVGGGSAGAVAGAISRAEHPIQPILNAESVDEVITKAHEAVGDTPVTIEGLDTAIREQQSIANQTIETTTFEAKKAAERQAIEAEKAADLASLGKVLQDEQGSVTTGEAGTLLYEKQPIQIVHPTELPTESTAQSTGLNKDHYDALSDVASLFGKRIVLFQPNGEMPDGVVRRMTDPSTIYLSRNTSADPFSVLMHETLHLMEGTEFHNAVRQTVWEQQTPTAKQRALKRHGPMSEARLLNEMVADIGGTEFNKPELWTKVYTNLQLKVGGESAKTEMLSFIDTIKGMIAKIKDLIVTRVWMGNLKQKSLAEQYVKDLTKVHDALAAGVADAIYNRKNSSPDAGKIALQRKSTKSAREIVHPEAVQAFTKLAEAQRGAPEQAMLKVQKIHGGGVLNPVVEHVGDLLHQMTEMSHTGDVQQPTVLSKINRALASLTHAYGFEKEHAENVKNNAKNKKTPVSEHRTQVEQALSAYANEHRGLPAYNLPQWLAREAAIAVGEQRFEDAAAHLKELKTLASAPDFGKHAFAYNKEGYRKPVNVKLIGVQRGIPNIPDHPLYNLETDIPGHKAGSTVTEETIREAGYEPNPTDLISTTESVAHRKSLNEKAKPEKVTNKPEKVDNKSEKVVNPTDDTDGKTKEDYDYASTQIDLPAPLAEKVLALGQQIKAEDLAEKGREDAPHLTVKYGLHSEDPAQVQALLAGHGPVTGTIGAIGMFETDDGDVLVLHVDSPALVELNKKITDNVENTTEYAYSPHITIAYVKPGLGKGYVERLRNTLKGQLVSAKELTFSDKSGEKTKISLEGEKSASPKEIEPSQPDKTKKKYTDWLEQLAHRTEQEAAGQEVLDNLEERGRTPHDVVNDFWAHTYTNLPEAVQKRFQRMITGVTGFKPGDTIATTKEGKPIIGRDWPDLYSVDSGDVPTDAQHLEGTDRGLIALMEIANERVKNPNQIEGPQFSPRRLPSTYPVSQPGRLDTIIRKLQDKNIDIKRVVEAMESAFGPVSEQLNPVLAEEMYQKRDEQRARDFTNDELRPLTDLLRLNKISVKQLDDYAHAVHVLDDRVNERLQAINPDLVNSPNYNKLSGITDAEAQAILTNANRPLMDSLLRHVHDMVETTRELMVSYGLESQDTIDAWRRQYKAYVPLRREGFDDKGHPTGKGRSVRGSTVRERGGSGLTVEHILANIAQARDQVVTRGEKMRPVIAFAGLMMLHPNPDIATLDKPATITYTDPQTGLPVTVPGNLTNYQVPTIRRYNPATGVMQTYPDPTYKGRENVVNFRIKGKDYAIVFNEQNERALEVAKAFKNLGTPQLNGIMRVIAPYTRYLAAVNTQYNPIFGIVNFVRDAQFAMLTLSSTPLAGKQGTVLKNAIGSLAGIYADARNVRKGITTTSATAMLWKRFEHVGGPTGYRDLFYSAKERMDEIERMMNPGSWKGIRNPQMLGKRVEETAVGKWLSDYNLTMENAIRLGVFKTAVDNGISDLKAASLAKNITVNFGKKGQIGAQMGALYAFFNANVQGSARIAETLFDRTPGGFRLSAAGKKIIVGGILVGVLQTVMLALAGFDDDDPPEFVKQKNLIFPAPWTDKGYAMIPMPLGFNLLPNVGRLTAEVVKAGIQGHPLKIFDKAANLINSIYSTLSPLGGSGGLIQELMPTTVDPFAAIATNKDWTGRSIAKEDHSALKPTPGFTRAHDTATVWAKGLAYAVNWATGGSDFVPGVLSPTPDQIDFLVQQATGGIGREFSKAAQVVQSLRTGEEMPTHKIPLVGRFVGSATGSSSIRARFYEHVKEANLSYQEFEGRALAHEEFSEYVRTHPQARFAKVAQTVQDDLAVLEKQKRLMLKLGESRDAVRLQESRITNLMSRFNSLVEKAQTP